MNRRDFLKGVTLTSLGLTVAAEEITARAQNAPAGQAAADDLHGPPVSCAVIGLGARGREILAALAKMGTFAPVASICDTFSAPVFVKKAQAIAPSATFQADHRKVLDDKSIQAVFIATPSHKHKQVALDAIAAGKAVYCEAPLSNDLAEARAIAQAGAGAKVFQVGLQQRCNAQAVHVDGFILSQAIGKVTGGRAQWHKKTSWRQAWPTEERQKELNWRLSKATSPGLMGEEAIHQLDTATWYFQALPEAVTGYSAIKQYTDDGRDVPDIVQAVFEFPNNVRYLYDATITSSFDDAYELFQGTEATVMLRDLRAWMFKEPESTPLGWEGFARRDVMQIGKPENGTGLQTGTGIALVADATKQIALGKDPGAVGTDVTHTALFQACRVFLDSVRAGKPVPVKEPTKEHPKPPLAPGAQEGYRATVVALKANEAALSGSRVVFDKDAFTL